MKMLSLFSGIGAFEKALKNIDIDYELVNYCEIDKYASKAYSLIHGVSEDKNLGDITKVDTSKLPSDIDLITYGFPCQDISLAGMQKGFEHDGKRTRSGLFFEALRIIEDTKPKYAIAENVKNLVSNRFKKEFETVISSLKDAGYNSYWAVLNAKDFGVPQNRERVFIVSIRQDIDDGKFEFPQPQMLLLRLKDLLEENVDERYFMSDKAIDYICANGTKNFSYKPKIDLEVARPLTSTMHKAHRASQDNYVSEVFVKDDIKVDIVNGKPVVPIRLGNIYGNHVGTGYAGNVWDKHSISPTITTMQGGNRQPMIIQEEKRVLVREATVKGYAEAEEGDSINFEQPNSKTRRGRVGKQVAQTLTTSPHQGVVIDGR